MRRRDFVTSAAVAGAGLATGAGSLDARTGPADDGRQYLDLREYRCISGKRMKILEDYISGALIPAYKRLGIGPVGAFKQTYGPNFGALMVLTVHGSLDSAATANAKLLDDAEVQRAGAEYFAAPIDNPPFIRMGSRLLRTLAGLPHLTVPEAAAGNKPRIFGFRTYDSHNERVARQKIEMVNAGEIEYFRRNGAQPVFFAETLFGEGMPSLSYMLAFQDMVAHDAAWAGFRDRKST